MIEPNTSKPRNSTRLPPRFAATSVNGCSMVIQYFS